MSAAAWFERTGNLAYALRRRREDDARTRWSRDRLLAFQRAQLSSLVAHASRHSPFYRALYGGPVCGDVELTALPVVTKRAMMADFERVLTVPGLTRARLTEHVATLRGDERLDGEFRVMASSGSSGEKALFVYDRAAWRAGFMPGSLRMTSFPGLSPGLPRPRLATVAAGDGKHMTFRGGASMDVGIYRTARFSACTPLAELSAQLSAYRPDFVLGYPSVLALLAEEQRAGRLDIAPRAVVTSSELRTPAMARAIVEAWGRAPFDCLGLTETGIAAVECEAHQGLHVFEDLCIIEVVDDAGRPVPMRSAGAKILVTNLFNRIQPIIRFEVSDLVTLDDAPCPCGRTLARIVALDGRSDDVLTLPGSAAAVRVHPLALRSVLGRDPAVLQYQVTWDERVLDVQVMLADGVDGTGRLELAVQGALAAAGARAPVVVRRVAHIARESGPGKLKLVRRVPAP